MVDALLTRVRGDLYTIAAEGDGLEHVKIGQAVRCKVVKVRNYEHHKKYFALMNTAFDWWTPRDVEYKGLPVAKNIDRFRHDVMILAGYGFPVIDVRGGVHMEAESISFGSMDQAKFEQVYSDCLQVILDKVLSRADEARLNEAVEAIMDFA